MCALKKLNANERERKKEENKNPLQTFSLPTDKNHKMHVETDELKVNMNAAVHHHVGIQQREVMGCCSNYSKEKINLYFRYEARGRGITAGKNGVATHVLHIK